MLIFTFILININLINNIDISLKDKDNFELKNIIE